MVPTGILITAIGITFIWGVLAVAVALTEEEVKPRPKLVLIQGGRS